MSQGGKREKSELKTERSVRRIELRPAMRETLRKQKELTARFEEPYVFLNTKGGPIQQENLGNKIWTPALAKAGVEHRRMYETRHTFASWAIGSGESPEWVARTLGHVDTTMVYRTYARYIPNLTRHDGSAFEMQYAAAAGKQKEAVQIGTNLGTMDCPEELSNRNLKEKHGRDDWI